MRLFLFPWSFCCCFLSHSIRSRNKFRRWQEAFYGLSLRSRALWSSTEASRATFRTTVSMHLLASPISGSALFFGKTVANFVLLLTIEFVSLPIFGLFYNVNWTRQLPSLVLVVALATWGIAVVGTTFSAMTVNMRLRELMLPMLVYPILIPCLLGAILLSADLIAGKPIGGNAMVWLRLLVGFDVIYTALAVTLIDNVLLG